VTIDYTAAIEEDSARLATALAANRDAPIPWCGDWTVKDCALHLASVHHVVARVVADRPDASFDLFATLERPEASDPALNAWLADGTAALVRALHAADPGDVAWTWWPADQSVGFWARRMAHESLVHRWDGERGAGAHVVPVAPALAADGVDEFLEIFVATTRAMHNSPGAGETAHLHCTDTDGEWLIALPRAGQYEFRREHAKGDVALRGPAESLLLFCWGRFGPGEGGIDVIGDSSIADRWRDLVPAM
jgi:uncharacterized protein (TIGR03083 family)